MIHHLQEQQRQHGSEWVSQPVPCPPRQPLPAGAVPAPSNPAAPSQLLPRQPGVTPTKAGAAPATLGLCPATWLRNLFLGASCHGGDPPLWPQRRRRGRRVSPSGRRALVCWRPPAPAYNGIKRPRSHPVSTVTESPRSPGDVGLGAAGSTGSSGTRPRCCLPTARRDASPLLPYRHHCTSAVWKC